jgi:hypothetical protein
MTGATQGHVDRATAMLLKHARGAPTPHFGDTRERSAAIRGRVHRLSDADLDHHFKVYKALAQVPWMIPREIKAAVYDVGHALWSEVRARSERKD